MFENENSDFGYALKELACKQKKELECFHIKTKKEIENIMNDLDKKKMDFLKKAINNWGVSDLKRVCLVYCKNSEKYYIDGFEGVLVFEVCYHRNIYIYEKCKIEFKTYLPDYKNNKHFEWWKKNNYKNC